MAPNAETLVASYTRNSLDKPQKPRRISMEGLQRAISDLSFELSKEGVDTKLAPISEVEDAKCECCGMSEECTPGYIHRVREKFSGKWICGLCSEAVKEEVEKNGGRLDEALNSHMSVCVTFNRIERRQPVLFQAEAMREILRRSRLDGRGARAKSSSPRDRESVKRGGITRSSSCIPAITKEIDEKASAN
ncbi:uncharacterized protein LOC103710968 [Phoenix dactylifera]|uniref:Uncharacterized protein LOC103710968 n=1 Tax=Phoenix dactylifera TaxID=42345 RepID=A0A8B7CAE6_PHODC|nr:uncharacterized protein LOC103710968 [Phoenix dactylifera]